MILTLSTGFPTNQRTPRIQPMLLLFQTTFADQSKCNQIAVLMVGILLTSIIGCLIVSIRRSNRTESIHVECVVLLVTSNDLTNGYKSEYTGTLETCNLH